MATNQYLRECGKAYREVWRNASREAFTKVKFSEIMICATNWTLRNDSVFDTGGIMFWRRANRVGVDTVCITHIFIVARKARSKE